MEDRLGLKSIGNALATLDTSKRAGEVIFISAFLINN
jgi:hypothetical protein